MTPIDYPELLTALGIDLALLFVIGYLCFFRRHKRRDVFVAIALINVTLFVLGGALGTFTISLGLGFALFSVISIFRFRSDTLGWNEIVYLLVALAIGLDLGLPAYDLTAQALYAAILTVAVVVFDSPKLFRMGNSNEINLTVNFVLVEPIALKVRVEEILSHPVKEIKIKSVSAEPASMKLEIEY